MLFKKKSIISLDPKFFTSFFVSFLFSSTLLVFSPLIIFFTNRSEFTISITEFLTYVIPLSLLLTIICSIILFSLNKSINRLAISLLLMVSLLIWFQGNILIWQYGMLDGDKIIWKRFWIRGLIDNQIWIFALIFAFVKPAFFYKKASMIAKVLIFIQFSYVLFVGFESQDLLPKCYTDKTNMFNLSKDKNVVILIIDEFQSDVFKEIIERDNTYKDIFEGFVYFPDALAGFSYTELAIPSLLTAEYYDNSVTREEYLRDAYLGGSIPKLLKDNGWQVELYPWLALENESIYYDERIASNFKIGKKPFKFIVKEMIYLFDLSLFRYSPHFLKKYIINDYKWFFSNALNKFLVDNRYLGRELEDNEFIAQAISTLRPQSDRATFKLYHLKGLHIPLLIRRSDLSRILYFEFNRANYIGVAKYYLNLCNFFFNKLKQNKLFDNSLIFIIGDHGSGRTKDLYIEPKYDENKNFLNPNVAWNGFQKRKARGIPLILVKKFNSREKLSISDSPVSLTDIPFTITSELKMDIDLPGVSIFDNKIEKNRKRYYGAFAWNEKKSHYVAPITMYIVEGFSWLGDSWEVLGVFPPKSKLRFSDIVDRINFDD